MGMKCRLTSISSAAPRETRLVFNSDRRGGETARSDRDQLQKSLQAVKRAQCRGRRKLRAGIGDCQLVRLIFAEFQQAVQSLIGMHGQRRSGASFGAKRNPSLPRKLRDEPLHAGLERRIVSASNTHGKRLCDRQHATALLHAGRHGHEIELRLGLR